MRYDSRPIWNSTSARQVLEAQTKGNNLIEHRITDNQKSMNRLLLTMAMSLAVTGSALADFQIDLTPGGDALNLDNVKNQNHSTGLVGTEGIGIDVVGNADFASGNATIKPAGTPLLTSLTFIPDAPIFFGDFS